MSELCGSSHSLWGPCIIKGDLLRESCRSVTLPTRGLQKDSSTTKYDIHIVIVYGTDFYPWYWYDEMKLKHVILIKENKSSHESPYEE